MNNFFSSLLQSFHWYGVIIALAIWVGVFLAEKKALKVGISESVFWQLIIWICTGGIIGARLYHVLTDFSLYQHNLFAIFQVWQGGLSILGAMFGGVCALVVYLFTHPRASHATPTFWQIADIAALCLPLSQAIGRIGNWINQELYGLPTTLPWGIFINVEKRLTEYKNFTHFHPLFAYEMIGLVLFFIWEWMQEKQKKLKIGTGDFFLQYVVFYSVFRFCLDFLRPDKTYFSGIGLGVNQVVLGIVFLSAILYKKKMLFSSLKFLMLFFVATAFLTGCQRASNETSTKLQSTESAKSEMKKVLAIPDHQKQFFSLKNSSLQLEVVHSPEASAQGLSDRSEIGSDGMLFLFTPKQSVIFWMKGMQFDLDMVWLDDFTVAGITRDIPHPTSEQQKNLNSLPRYTPPQPINGVLELPAGKATSLGIEKGDILKPQ
jgi:phosphatidylglycerol:prolipoprotein diacylglycerol transferase